MGIGYRNQCCIGKYDIGRYTLGFSLALAPGTQSGEQIGVIGFDGNRAFLRPRRHGPRRQQAVEEAARPILGICRGSQLLNVHRGGTIIPDIEDFVLHRGGEGEPMFLDEKIRLVPGTRLRQVMGADIVVGRSGHHQAVDALGAGLVIAAVAEDGIVEGFEDPDHWLVGVQWHPEDDDGPEQDRTRLFRSFVRACAGG